jgi:hypothetical protein
VEEYFATCSWINDIYGWKFGWQMKMDELFHEHWQQICFCKKLNKRIKMEKNYVGLFWKIEHMKCWNHALGYTTFEPYRMLN